MGQIYFTEQRGNSCDLYIIPQYDQIDFITTTSVCTLLAAHDTSVLLLESVSEGNPVVNLNLTLIDTRAMEQMTLNVNIDAEDFVDGDRTFLDFSKTFFNSSHLIFHLYYLGSHVSDYFVSIDLTDGTLDIYKTYQHRSDCNCAIQFSVLDDGIAMLFYYSDFITIHLLSDQYREYNTTRDYDFDDYDCIRADNCQHIKLENNKASIEHYETSGEDPSQLKIRSKGDDYIINEVDSYRIRPVHPDAFVIYSIFQFNEEVSDRFSYHYLMYMYQGEIYAHKLIHEPILTGSIEGLHFYPHDQNGYYMVARQEQQIVIAQIDFSTIQLLSRLEEWGLFVTLPLTLVVMGIILYVAKQKKQGIPNKERYPVHQEMVP